MAHVHWASSRAFLPWCCRSVGAWELHAHSFGNQSDPLNWIRLPGKVVIYAWSPTQKKLTTWTEIVTEISPCVSFPRKALRDLTMLRKMAITEPTKRVISDSSSAKRWPCLWEHLTQTTWGPPDNEDRPTSTITLFLRDDGTLGASLSDKANARTCFASGETVLGLLDTLDACASNPSYAWREDRQQTGSSKRKK